MQLLKTIYKKNDIFESGVNLSVYKVKEQTQCCILIGLIPVSVWLSGSEQLVD